MNAGLKSLTALAVTAILGSSVAQAVTVDFGYKVATDGSGKTSQKINASNVVDPATGYYIETFDQATGNPGSVTTYPGVQFLNTDCSINTLGTAGTLTVTGGGFAITKNSVGGVNAAPAGNSSCYGFGPAPGSATTTATARIDYSGDLVPGVKISYLGLYYGSIDSYNNLAFYDEEGLMTGGGGLLNDGVISGIEILTLLGGETGNQVDDRSNVYVNFTFEPDEAFTAFEIRTIGRAVEADNIVTGLTNRRDLPEPGSLAMLGLGLAGLAVARRRKAA